MNDESIDRILGGEEELIPSSGFVASVMDRIRDEAAAPLPIPFPWKRAVPGLVLGCAGLGWGVVELARHAIAAGQAAQTVTINLPTSLLQSRETLGWVALALGVSLVSWWLARRMSGAGAS
ncbi:MAG: hypothetical protein WCC26_17210 [Terracidiphilus sp.]